MPYKTLLVECENGVGVITLNRPERLNAMNFALTEELEEALTVLEVDDSVRVVVVTGAGEKAFSAGADIHEMNEQPGEELKDRASRRLNQNWHLAAYKKPTIGAINGLAYDGGALLASIFDMRIGCERTSFRFLGVTYGKVNSTWTLPLIVGLPMAKELLFTGRVVKADEALNIGLLNRLVPSSELMKTAIDTAKQIAVNDSKVVQGIKHVLTGDVGLSWQEMLTNEVETMTRSLQAPHPSDSFQNLLRRTRKQ